MKSGNPARFKSALNPLPVLFVSFCCSDNTVSRISQSDSLALLTLLHASLYTERKTDCFSTCLVVFAFGLSSLQEQPLFGSRWPVLATRTVAPRARSARTPCPLEIVTRSACLASVWSTRCRHCHATTSVRRATVSAELPCAPASETLKTTRRLLGTPPGRPGRGTQRNTSLLSHSLDTRAAGTTLPGPLGLVRRRTW